jgi:hypothetical protein
VSGNTGRADQARLHGLPTAHPAGEGPPLPPSEKLRFER